MSNVDGYEIVGNCFKEWIETQSFIDIFYVAVFLAKRARSSFEHYEIFFELFEYDFDGKGGILWQIDWCEGEDDITDLRFYSLNDIKNIIIDAESHKLNNTGRKWFNKWG